jgi:hypothetical protein
MVSYAFFHHAIYPEARRESVDLSALLSHRETETAPGAF